MSAQKRLDDATEKLAQVIRTNPSRWNGSPRMADRPPRFGNDGGSQLPARLAGED